MKQDQCKKVLITCGKTFLKNTDKLQQIEQKLQQYNIEYYVFEGIRCNPEIHSVYQAIDSILAIGGGSVVDCSKMISGISGTLIQRGIKETTLEQCWDFVEKKEKLTKSLSLYVLLTLSATGSEHNNVCVISNDQQRKKYGVTENLFFPKVSGVCLKIQETLPKYQQVNALVDSQMHILEACFADDNIQPYEVIFQQDINFCKDIIVIGNKLLDQTITNEQYRLELRKQFAWICSCALNGVCTAGTNGRYRILHQLEHAMAASIPTISHGAGLGVIFSGYLRYCQENNERVKVLTLIGKQLFGAQNIDEFVIKYREMLEQWGHPRIMKELLGYDVSEKLLDEFAENFGMKSLAGFNGTQDELMKAGRRIIELSCF